MPPAEAGPLTRGLRAAGRFLLRVPWPLGLLLVFSWGFVIWDLSAQRAPIPAGPSLLWELLSNLAHAPLFGVLTLFTAALVLRRRDGAWPRAEPARVALVLALVTGYGVFDEWHQSRVPGRDASALDVLTDGLSAALVLWIVFLLGRNELGERALALRLGAGVLACVACAALALLS